MKGSPALLSRRSFAPSGPASSAWRRGSTTGTSTDVLVLLWFMPALDDPVGQQSHIGTSLRTIKEQRKGEAGFGAERMGSLKGRQFIFTPSMIALALGRLRGAGTRRGTLLQC